MGNEPHENGPPSSERRDDAVITVSPSDDVEATLQTVLQSSGEDRPTVLVLGEFDEQTVRKLAQNNDVAEGDVEWVSRANAKLDSITREHPADVERASHTEPNQYGDLEGRQNRQGSSGPSQTTTEEPSESTGRLVGIPAYNESAGIGSVVLAAQEYADEVVVIDDGSTDDTAEIARNAGATVLEHDENRGKGRALKTFLDYARTSAYDAHIVLDGDGQHLPRDIPSVIEPVENGRADLVIGSRYLDDETPNTTPVYRRCGQWLLDLLTFGSSGVRLSDTQSGFRAFSPRAIESLTIRTDGMGVESEMIGTATEKELRIMEVPIDIRYDGVDGQTLHPVRHGLSVTALLLRLVRDRHPLLFFSVPGLVFTVAGVGLGVDAVVAYDTDGVFPLGQTLLSMLVTLIGVLSVFFGVVLNRLTNLRAELEAIV